MPRLLELPNEVLEQITESFLPDDIDNFSISCRHFYTLSAAKFPQHKEMKTRYSHASCSTDGSGSFDFEHPVFLLQALFQNPDIAKYVKSLCISKCQSSEKSRDASNDLREAVTHDGREQWIQDLLNPRGSNHTVLIAMMLRYLEKYVIRDSDAVRKVAGLTWAISTRGHNVETRNLSKLSYVELTYGGGSHTNGDSVEILSFADLPSIRYLRVTGLNDTGQHLATTQSRSPLAKLVLDECEIHPNNLQHIIGSITALREFSYRCFLENAESPFHIYPSGFVADKKPKEFVQSLLKSASHSLVSLDLTDRWHKPAERISRGHFLGPLQEFQVLKKIRVEYRMFVEDGYVKPSELSIKTHRMTDVIPVSLEWMTLTGPMLDKKSIAKLIEGLGECKRWFSLMRPVKAKKASRLEKVFYESSKSSTLRLFSNVEGLEFILKQVTS